MVPGTFSAVVAVFCAASDGNDPAFLQDVEAFAQQLHKANAKLIYGGGTTGAMGLLARTLVKLSGPDAVQGIMLRDLIAKEIGADALIADEARRDTYGHLHIVDSLAERMELMVSEVVNSPTPAGGFVALPGGTGTLLEIVQVAVERKHGWHGKAIVVLGHETYWSSLISLLQHMVQSGFEKKEMLSVVKQATTFEEAVGMLGCRI